jgi:hypothetical protein
VITFADAQSGGSRQYLLNGTAIQSMDTASFWTFVWANTGQKFTYTLAPFGNVTPTADQRHLTGEVIIGPKPDLGGEANISANSAFTFDFSWQLVQEPSLLPAIATVPVVTAVSPVTGAVAGGTLVRITGTSFQGATAVKFGTTNATSFIVDDNNEIFATAPAQAAGAKNITVVTPGGTSNAQAFTYV